MEENKLTEHQVEDTPSPVVDAVTETPAETGDGEWDAATAYKKEDYSFKKRQQDFLASFSALVDMYGVTIKPAIIFQDMLAEAPAVQDEKEIK